MEAIKIIDSEIEFHYKEIKRIKSRINQLIVLKQDLSNNELDFNNVPRGTFSKTDYSDAVKIIEYFSKLRIKSKITDRPLKVTKDRKKIVYDRIKESSPKEAVEVIKTRFVLWMNTDMQKYLKIETIFRSSKYFKYLDEVGEIYKQKQNKNWDAIGTETTGDF